MIAWPCSGREGTELLHLDLPQGGPLTTAGPDGTFTAELEMAAVQPDGSVQLTTSAGELNLLDRSEGLIYARGSLAGFHQGVLLASPQSDQVEQLWAPASGCGQDLDTSPLIEAGLADVTWNSRGDPCAAPGLRLDLSASPPTLERSGISLEILGVTVTNLGIWVTASAEGEGLHGLRLTGQADGSLTVLQRLDTDLASETLLRVEGRCAKQKPHPRRRRKPRRPGPDHRLPR